jgi:hypothetical protein
MSLQPHAPQVKLWNGNRSEARKVYEVEITECILNATDTKGNQTELVIDNTDYPSAEDEGRVLEQGADLLITVAGNIKFADKPKIVIHQALAKGILGYRIPIIRTQDEAAFAKIRSIEQLRSLPFGVPETWFDAQLFRENSCQVVERGGFEDLFPLLKAGAFDYTTLGVNEVEAAFESMGAPLGALKLEANLLLYYPLPLVFYVNIDKPKLAERIERGLSLIRSNGTFDRIFNKHHGNLIERLNLKTRKVLTLKNSALPNPMKAYQSDFLG